MKPGRLTGKVAAYWELTKPNIAAMVLVTTALGFYMSTRSAGGAWEGGRFLLLMIGAALTAGGVGSLNEFWERESDGQMRRTRGRPLPSGRLAAGEALRFGLAISALGLVILALWVHPVTALLAGITLVSYILVYTPLKKRTAWNTLVGAVPGALPPLGGWVAATGEVSPGAWALFAILFFWQIPHFMSIATIYRTDYARAGMKMLPGADPTGRRTALAIILFSVALVIGSLVPTYLGISGWPYLAGAAVLGMGFLVIGLQAARHGGNDRAHRLLMASIIYLPALLVLMVIDLELFR